MTSTRGPELPDPDRLRLIARIASARGRTPWLVGGPVRDLLLGRDVGDLDLAFDGDVQLIGRAIARELDGEFTWHPRFLTGCVDFNGRRIDLAGTRAETYAQPAALPRVQPCDIETDLTRRDFSVNAMALAVRTRGAGALLDPCGGRPDLAARLLRILHADSFVDDPTRAYRALRFATRLGFRLERETRRRLGDAVGQRMHHRLSGQRVAVELRKALAEERAAATLTAYVRAGLASFWEIDRESGFSTPLALRYANRRLQVWGLPPERLSAMRIACAFGRLPRARRRVIARRLKLRRVETLALVDAIGPARQILARVRRARGRAALDRACASGGDHELLLAALHADARTFSRIVRWWRQTRVLRLEIDGHDLIQAGIPSGPRIARALSAARAAYLAGRARNRQEQLAVAVAAGGRT